MGRFPCFDSGRLEFWLPDNWPGLLAPVRLEIGDLTHAYERWGYAVPPERFTAGARLWVQGPDGENDLWSIASTQGFSLSGAHARAVRMGDELKAERAEAIHGWDRLAADFAEAHGAAA